MNVISLIISTLIQCLIGWLLIDKVPVWLKISGLFATIIKVIGVLVIIRALLAWVV
jgi:amino acid permease